MKSEVLEKSSSVVWRPCWAVVKLIYVHVYALVLSVCIGVAIVVPQYIAVWQSEDFRGMYPQVQDDSQYYMARVQEVYDGRSTFAQPFLYEGKDGFSLQFWLPETITAQIGKWLSLDAEQVLLFSDFLFPSIAALLTYGIFYEFTRKKSIALVGTAFLFLGVFLNLFGRPISPQCVFLPMLGFILSLLLLERIQSWRLVVMTGVLYGVLFHTYAYHWMYATVALGLYGLSLLLVGRWDAVRRILLVGCIGFLISIPYFLHFFRTLSLPEYHDTMMRLGMLSTHFPSGIVIVGLAGVYVVGCGTFFLLQRKTFVLDRQCMLISALVCAVPVVANQHIITGQNLEFSSHYRTIGIFVSLFGYVFLAHRFVEYARSSRVRLGAVCILGIMVGVSVWSMSNVVKTQMYLDERTLSQQHFVPILEWLSGHTEKDAVVYAHSSLSALIPAYTDKNVFYAREANMHFMSNESVWKRALLSLYFEPGFDRDALISRERAFFGTFYINRSAHADQQNKVRALFGVSLRTYERYPESDISILVDQWHLQAETPFRELVKEYRIDYVLWDKKTDPLWQPKLEASELTAVFQSDDFVLYEL